jgi:hypothetical protein
MSGLVKRFHREFLAAGHEILTLLKSVRCFPGTLLFS